MRKSAAVAALGLLAACSGAEEAEPVGSGQDESQLAAAGHQAHEPDAAAGRSDAARAYDESMARMHRDMGRAGDDADETFMRAMIPHHRGAVEMAEIVLEHGKDPEARALARSIIASQTAEIEQMEAWLARHEAGAADR